MPTDDRRNRGGLARGMLVLVAAALGVFVAAAPVAAQLTTGTISGSVVDEGGLALPGASVTITNTGTGATRSTTTDSSGAYLVTALSPGLYRVNVTVSGFQPFLEEEFRLAVGQNARVDAKLAVGSITEQVSVVANSLRVDTRSSAVMTVVDPQRMQELPMLNRSVLTLAVLAPGITDVSVPDAVTDQRSAPTINSAATGGRTNQNDLQLDGATLTTSLYNRASNLPSPDSIQEFQVLTNSYSAEYRPRRRDQPPRDHQVGQQSIPVGGVGVLPRRRAERRQLLRRDETLHAAEPVRRQSGRADPARQDLLLLQLRAAGLRSAADPDVQSSDRGAAGRRLQRLRHADLRPADRAAIPRQPDSQQPLRSTGAEDHCSPCRCPTNPTGSPTRRTPLETPRATSSRRKSTTSSATRTRSVSAGTATSRRR